MNALRQAVFLDRDGVLVESRVVGRKPYPPQTLDEVVIAPGVPNGLQRLRKAGFLLIVVTNQPDVARGTTSRRTVETIHDHLRDKLPLNDVFTCFQDGDHPDRKPNPGMLLRAMDLHQIDSSRSFMIGDCWKDIEAGRRAGCRTVLLDFDYDEPKPDPPADFTTQSFFSSTKWILSRLPCNATHKEIA